MNAKQQIEEMEQDLRKCHERSSFGGYDGEIEYTDYDDMANRMFQKGWRKQSDWISVKDRFPDETCECLIVDTLGVIFLASYSSRYRAFNATDEDDGDRWRFNNITHWMPLPEPPKMKGGEG